MPWEAAVDGDHIEVALALSHDEDPKVRRTGRVDVL